MLSSASSASETFSSGFDSLSTSLEAGWDDSFVSTFFKLAVSKLPSSDNSRMSSSFGAWGGLAISCKSRIRKTK